MCESSFNAILQVIENTIKERGCKPGVHYDFDEIAALVKRIVRMEDVTVGDVHEAGEHFCNTKRAEGEPLFPVWPDWRDRIGAEKRLRTAEEAKGRASEFIQRQLAYAMKEREETERIVQSRRTERQRSEAMTEAQRGEMLEKVRQAQIESARIAAERAAQGAPDSSTQHDMSSTAEIASKLNLWETPPK